MVAEGGYSAFKFLWISPIRPTSWQSFLKENANAQCCSGSDAASTRHARLLHQDMDDFIFLVQARSVSRSERLATTSSNNSSRCKAGTAQRVLEKGPFFIPRLTGVPKLDQVDILCSDPPKQHVSSSFLLGGGQRYRVDTCTWIVRPLMSQSSVRTAAKSVPPHSKPDTDVACGVMRCRGSARE